MKMKQCPHPDESLYSHLYGNVEIKEGYCEMGYDCLSYCQYAWPPVLQHFAQQIMESIQQGINDE